MAAVKSTSIKVRKKAMLAALKKTLGIITTAAESVGITRQMHYNWYRDDPAYRQAVDEMDDFALDFTESRMFKAIQDGDASLIKFHLQTKGKKRGYGNAVEVTGKDGTPLHPEGQPATQNTTIIAGADAMEVYAKMIRGK